MVHVPKRDSQHFYRLGSLDISGPESYHLRKDLLPSGVGLQPVEGEPVRPELNDRKAVGALEVKPWRCHVRRRCDHLPALDAQYDLLRLRFFDDRILIKKDALQVIERTTADIRVAWNPNIDDRLC